MGCLIDVATGLICATPACLRTLFSFADRMGGADGFWATCAWKNARRSLNDMELNARSSEKVGVLRGQVYKYGLRRAPFLLRALAVLGAVWG